MKRVYHCWTPRFPDFFIRVQGSDDMWEILLSLVGVALFRRCTSGEFNMGRPTHNPAGTPKNRAA